MITSDGHKLFMGSSGFARYKLLVISTLPQLHYASKKLNVTFDNFMVWIDLKEAAYVERVF